MSSTVPTAEGSAPRLLLSMLIGPSGGSMLIQHQLPNHALRHTVQYAWAMVTHFSPRPAPGCRDHTLVYPPVGYSAVATVRASFCRVVKLQIRASSTREYFLQQATPSSVKHTYMAIASLTSRNCFLRLSGLDFL